MDKVIYTAIFNDYDNLKKPHFVNEDYDYVLFTDEYTAKAQNLSKQSMWDIRIVKGIRNKLEGLLKAKEIKINCHKFLPEYKSSVYIDASFIQLKDIKNFTEDNNYSFKVCNHPQRHCLYVEADVCARQRLGNMHGLSLQIEKYKKEEFPKNYGLYMGGILGREHTEKCNKINDLWWEEICNGSTRDQTSLPYVIWKLKEKIGTSDFDNHILSVLQITLHK